MVGAADGLGGRLMRTVSFFGWTLPVSFFMGGTAPGAGGGMAPTGGEPGAATMLAMMDGKLMLTVSFFGATLPVVFFIGSAPGGGVGVFGGMSAINFHVKISAASCLSNLIQKNRPA
jgi:hypothetical protein